MKIKIKNKIVHVEFPNRKELTLTMGRLGEYYESSFKALRNKNFSMETFLDTFMDKDGKITYFNSWSGYNIPGNIVNKFTPKDGETSREEELLDAISEFIGDYDFAAGDFYLIATIKGGDAMDHELVHATYYLNKEYCNHANQLVKELPKEISSTMKATFKEMGYAKEVYIDEINAYLSTADAKYMKDRFNLKVPAYIMQRFRLAAKQYAEVK